MPIAFSCPHCGKQTTVADQYAGQSGPCAACGQTITIPAALPPTAYGSTPPRSSGGSGVIIGVIVALSAVVLAVVTCAGLGFYAMRSSMARMKTASARMQSANNMKQILIAVHSYHDRYQEFPPAVVRDADGNPLYSGMVLLLPYLEHEHVHRQFNLAKPWDSPENTGLSQLDLPLFKNPAAQTRLMGKTDYLFVGGPQSLLDSGTKASFANCTDGTSNTMILVEAMSNNRSWAEPTVWTPNQPLVSETLDVVNVGMADGSVHAFPKSMPQQQLILLANPSDGTPVNVP